MKALIEFGEVVSLMSRIDLTVTVLTTGFWLCYKSFDLNFLVEMVSCVSQTPRTKFPLSFEGPKKCRTLDVLTIVQPICNLSSNFNDHII